MKNFILIIKKFQKLLLLTLTCLITINTFSPKEIAFAETSYYAKVENSDVYFYSFPNNSSILFEIPLSFFVLVGQSSGNYFKATYNGISGYVKKSDVSLMNGTPKNAFFKQQFSVIYPNLYEEASSSSEILSDQLNKNITLEYYGIKHGEFLSEDNNTWYYVKANIDGEAINGYVFSQFIYTNPLKNFKQNTEHFAVVTEDMLATATSNQFQALSTGTKILLVFAIAIPSVLILYFLIKPSKIMQLGKTKQKTLKHTRKKVRHGDYFEFDENEL